MSNSLRALTLLSVMLASGAAGPGRSAGATSPTTLPQAFPDRLVRLVEPFGAGGGPDLLARALAPKLSELWHQPVSVQNVTGAGATAGPAQVAKSPADGFTLLVNTSAQAYSAALAKGLPYDPLKDFIPVASLTSQPYVLVASKAARVATIGQLMEAAKARPGALRFGSSGVGTGTHLGVEKLNLAAGISAVHVPSGPADAISDSIATLVAGGIDYRMAPIELVLPHIRDGRLVALGVSTLRRSPLLPEVPTISEGGVAGFDFPIWYGVWVPAGTPAAVVDRLAEDIGHVMGGPDLRDWIARHGGEPMTMTQPRFARFILEESEAAARILKAAGARLP